MSGTWSKSVPEEAIVAAPSGWMDCSVVGDGLRPSEVGAILARTGCSNFLLAAGGACAIATVPGRLRRSVAV